MIKSVKQFTKLTRQISVSQTRINQALLTTRIKTASNPKQPLNYTIKSQKDQEFSRLYNSLQSSIQNNELEISWGAFEGLLKKGELGRVGSEELGKYLAFLCRGTLYSEKSIRIGLVIVEQIIGRGGGLDASTDDVFSVMSGLVFLQDGVRLEKFLRLILTNNIPVNTLYVEALLFYYSRHGPVSSMEKLIKYCVGNNIGTTERFYKLLIDAYGRFGQPYKSLHVLGDMETEGHPVGLSILGRVLRGFGLAGEKSGVKIVDDLIRSRGLAVTDSFRIELLLAYKNTNQTKNGMKIIDEISQLKAGSSESIDQATLGPKTLSIMLGMFTRQGMMDEASELFEKLLKQGYPVDAPLFNVMLNGYRVNCDEEKFLHYYKLMNDNQIRSDMHTRGTLISFYGFVKRDYNQAIRLWEENGNSMDKYTIGTMISISLANGLPQESFKWFKMLVEAGMTPNSLILGSLLRASCLEKSGEELIKEGVKYLGIAAKLDLVDKNVLSGLFILQASSGTLTLKECLHAYADSLRKYAVKVDRTVVLGICDVVLRPSTFLKESCKIIPYSYENEEGLLKKEGKLEFQEILNGLSVDGLGSVKASVATAQLYLI